MRRLLGKGLEHGCTRHQLIEAIISEAGSTKETRDKYMTELKRHRFIKQTDGGSFELNYTSVEDDLDTTLIGDLTIRVDMIEKAVNDTIKLMEDYIKQQQGRSE